MVTNSDDGEPDSDQLLGLFFVQNFDGIYDFSK